MGLLDRIKGALGAKPEPPKPASGGGNRSGAQGSSGGGQGQRRRGSGGGQGGQGNRSGGQGNRSGGQVRGQGQGNRSGGQGGQARDGERQGGEAGTATRNRNRRGGRGRGSGGGQGGAQGSDEGQASAQGSGNAGTGQRTRSRGGRGRGTSSGRVTRGGEGSTRSENGEGASGEAREGRSSGSGSSTRSRSGSGQRPRSGRSGSSTAASGGGRARSRRGGRTRDRVRRGSSSSGSQRRVLDANERPAEPVKKQILINASDPNEIRVAIREQQRVVEVYVERKGHRSLAGNIYKGRVQNVLPGMEAAFVDIGLERNGFLYVDEVTPAAADSDQAMPVKVATGGDPVAHDDHDHDETPAGKLAQAAAEHGETLDIESVSDEEADAQPSGLGDPDDADPFAQNAEPVTDADLVEEGLEPADGEKPARDRNSGGSASIAGEGSVKNSGARRARGQSQAKRKIQELLKPGQEILCQVVKDPMGTKGSRLTTQYSLAGRYLVYVPDGEGLGVSRRLLDAERERLRDIVKQFELPQGGGLIVRTAAEGALEEDIEKDLQLLLALHEKLMDQHGDQRAPKLLYNEADLSLRIIRDLFNDEVEGVVVDDPRQYQRIISYLQRTSPSLTERVKLHEGGTPLFEQYEVEEAIRSTLNKRVNLPSGGYLIIDYAEAFTVIDINTGKAVGKTSLEDTITKTNMEAAEEIVRQLRLRDIGGIVVLDFIDMNLMKNRDAVLEHFRKELSKDRTKTYLVEISPLGLIEMTRQNVSEGVREMLTSTCRVCEGRGVTVSAETYAIDVERAIVEAAEVMGSGVEAIAVELAPSVAGLLSGNQARIDEVSARAGKRVRVFSDPELDQNAFVVKRTGSVAEIEALPVPLRRGEQLKVMIERVDPLSDNDGVAIVDGVIVVVLGAGAEVGQERTILIAAAEGDRAFATLVKPARRRRRRGGRGRGKARTGADGAVLSEDELEEGEELDAEDLEGEEYEDDVDESDESEDAAAQAAEQEEEGSEIPDRLLRLEDDEDESEDDDDPDDDDDDEDEDEDDDPDDPDEDDDPDDDPATAAALGEDEEGDDDERFDEAPLDQDDRGDEYDDRDENEDGDTAAAVKPGGGRPAPALRADGTPRPPRRRGSRGGRNRKRPAGAGTGSSGSGADGVGSGGDSRTTVSGGEEGGDT